MDKSTDEGKAEKTFKSFGKKVDAFMEELNEASEKLKVEFQQKYEELKQSAEKIREESANKEKWKEVEDNLKKAGAELKNAFSAAFGKKKDG